VALPGVEAATMLLVGEKDVSMIALDREAYGELRCEKALEIVPGTTHLFEEFGALDQVARLTRGWSSVISSQP
jgi:putative phosphoribosyl transferase